MTEKTLEAVEPCKYHKSMCDSLVKFASHINDLKEDNIAQSKILARVESTVTAINETLIGTLQKQGMIGRVDKELSDLSRDLRLLKEWQIEIDLLKDKIIGKIIGGVFMAIIAGSVIATAVVNWIGK